MNRRPIIAGLASLVVLAGCGGNNGEKITVRDYTGDGINDEFVVQKDGTAKIYIGTEKGEPIEASVRHLDEAVGSFKSSTYFVTPNGTEYYNLDGSWKPFESVSKK